jgi:hypothetical protein
MRPAFSLLNAARQNQPAFTRPNGDNGSRWFLVKKKEQVRIEDSYKDWLFVDSVDGQQTGWIPSNICQREEVQSYLAFRRSNPDNCGNEGRC